MSNKTAAVLILLLLALSGFLYYQHKQELKNAYKQESLISSIKDAYKIGMSVQCNHEEPNGSVRIFIRDGGLRFDNTLPNYKGMIRHYINKNDVTHVWRNDKGVIFRDISKNTYGKVSPLFITTDQALAMVEPYKDSCIIDRFEDDIFKVAPDVAFIDVRTNAEAQLLPTDL
jgi:hypothetical protein